MTLIASFGSIDYMDKKIANIFKNGSGYWNTIKGNFQLEDYAIGASPRPEQLAYELYGDPNLFWVLLLVNEINDPWNGWIKDDQIVHEQAKHRYQDVGGVYQIHHHETLDGEKYFDLVEFPISSRVWYDKGDVNHNYPQYVGELIPITRIEHQLALNEELRVIKIIRRSSINQFLDLMESIIEKSNDVTR